VVATATASFPKPDNGTMTITFSNGAPNRTIPISRFAFATPSFEPSKGSFQNGWWWNDQESGTGYFVEVQGDQAFIASFMYDTAGQPTWYASLSSLSGTNVLAGALDIYANGQALGAAYKAPTANAGGAGLMSYGFSSDSIGNMTLPNAAKVAIKRFVFDAGVASNHPPAPNAGPNQTVTVGDTVNLIGTGTDTDGDLLTFSWRLISAPAGSTSTLNSWSTSKANFVADVVGAYRLELIADDGKVSNGGSVVTVTSTAKAAINLTPIAKAGVDRNVAVGTTVNLNGSASYDPNGDAITFSWSFISKPSGSNAALDSPTSTTPSFKADNLGFYVLGLNVSDGKSTSVTSQLIVNAVTYNDSIKLSNNYFIEVPNAFPDLKKYIDDLGGSAMMTNVTAVDLNKDGLLDILIHLWHRPNTAELLSKLTASSPTPNRLIALVQKSDGLFEDQTEKMFGLTPMDLGGAASRKNKVADLNGDGYPDIIYATNKEDGRSYMDGTAWTAYSAAIISNANGTYNLNQFGLKNYHHSVEITKNPVGGADIMVGEGEPGYNLKNGSFNPLDQFKFNSSGTILAFQSGGNNFTNQILTTAMESNPGIIGYNTFLKLFNSLDYFTWNESAIFKLDGARSVKFGDNVATAYDNIIYTYKNKEYVDPGYGGFYESCSFKLYPSQDPLMAVHWTPMALKGGSGGRSFINSNETILFSKILTLAKDGNKLFDLEVLEQSENQENINFIGCSDLNGDGYQDIVAYPYRPGARPIVHINNKSGKLKKLDDAIFPEGPNTYEWTSLFADLRGNGLSDLIYFPGNGCQSFNASCTKFKLMRAIKKLD